ncbi:MAG: hypothetical protein Q4P33_04145 [Flaviflexus sp.]|nr:hypothetical protein [Flaviflexus sp.]
MNFIQKPTTLGAVAISATAIAIAAPAVGSSSVDISASGMIGSPPIEQTEMDKLIREFDILDSIEVLPNTTRAIANNERGISWIGTTQEGNICLITRLFDEADGDPEDARITAANCATPLQFFRNGVSLRVEGAESGVVSHILPPDIELKTVKSAVEGHTLADTFSSSENVVVMMNSEAADKMGNIKIRRPHRSDFKLTSLGSSSR